VSGTDLEQIFISFVRADVQRDCEQRGPAAPEEAHDTVV
jgi:hypothetical protein